MMRPCLLWIVSFIAMAAPCGQAFSTPPAWVYRVDTRGPEEILRDGFVARGHDSDFADHFLSVSHSLGDSAFVSTTDDYYIALEFAQDVMRQRQLSEMFVYRIRATADFYNAVDTIRAHLRDIDAAGRAAVLSTYVRRLDQDLPGYEWEREWFVHGGIPSEQVSWVRMLSPSETPLPRPDAERPPIYLHEGAIVNNEHYVHANTQGNAEPYPMTVPETDPFGSSPSECSSSGDCPNDTIAVRIGHDWAHADDMPACSGVANRRSMVKTVDDCLNLVNRTRLRRTVQSLLGWWLLSF